MNFLTNHEAYAVANLKDKTAWLALIDHHEELLDVPHRVAVRAVVAMRRKARREDELKSAAKHMATGSRYARRLRDTIRAYFGSELVGRATIIVIEGRTRPKLHVPNNLGPDQPQGGTWISVGAAYILRLTRLAGEVDHLESEAHTAFISPLIEM